eukprot:TRINITY_DN26949_c0_g1_i1.p1 TRINITY_DN26949_c0_g1~~TRINITY_DN26949_c0_g1_i1.p1  ORF type:complete len:824 (+),score=168.95 TRINITY_DN26949_c0_g1_i1:193-2664(+)
MYADSSTFHYVAQHSTATRKHKQSHSAREIPLASTSFQPSGDISSQLYVKVENLEGGLPTRMPNDILIRCEIRVQDTVLGVQRVTSSIPPALVPRWDELLAFGVCVKDLPSSAMLHVAVTARDRNRVVAQASCRLFGKNYTLKRGRRKLLLLPPEEEERGQIPDDRGHIERMIKRLTTGKIRKVGWLDKLTFRRIEEMNQSQPTSGDRLYLLLEVDSVQNVPIVYQVPEKHVVLPSELCPIGDFQAMCENPIEIKSVMCVRHISCQDTQPNVLERRELQSMMNRLPTHVFNKFQQQLMYKYRHFLRREPKMLAPFLRSIEWKTASDALKDEVMELLWTWSSPAPAEALELLAPEQTEPMVRQYAVGILKSKASDQDLEMFLLQLVQAIRYEAEDQSPLSEFLMQRAARSPELANFLYWYLVVEAGNTRDTNSPSSHDNQTKNSQRDMATRFGKLLSRFMERELPQTEEGTAVKNGLIRSAKLVQMCRHAFVSTEAIKNSDDKKAALRQLLHESSQQDLQVSEDNPFMIPVQPDWWVTQWRHDKASIWASANAPIKVAFVCSDGQERALMYKAGDDLRQDQLVLQVIRLCDWLLKREGTDLELITYCTLATDAAEGFIELVPNSLTLYEIQKQYGSIIGYLTQTNGEMNAQVLDRYLKSLAGYCVITYLLGVGDRHLENLMLSSDGRLFHIDFGYILGKRPFAGAAQTRITHEMIETLGGFNSQQFTEFVGRAKETFNCLRKHAGLIMRLLLMMSDAGIVNANQPGSDDFKAENLHGIFEAKFWPYKSDEDAAAEFEKILIDSPYVLGSRVHDFFHDIKVRNKG